MTLKLMKYDLKNLFKLLKYFYVMTIALALVARLVNIWKDVQVLRIIGAVFTSLTYSAIATVLINMFITIIRNFVDTFYKDESYLTHTLPVKKKELINSKFLSSLIVVLTSVIVCFAGVLIMLWDETFFENLKVLLTSAMLSFSLPVGVIVTMLVLIIFAEICAFISMAFFAIIKGCEANEKRTLKSVLWFLALYFCSMFAVLLVAVVVASIMGEVSSLFANQMSQSVFLMLMIVALVVYIMLSILFYIFSQKAFKKGVNVD